MTELTKKITITSEALANLIEFFKNKPKIAAFISAFVDQSQDVEDGSFEVLLDTIIETAVGVQLDGIGVIVGRARGGLTDDLYRVRLQAQILLNKSSGTLDEILTIVALLEAAPIVDVSEQFPAGFVIEIIDIQGDPAQLAAIIAEARSAAVNGHLHYSLSPAAELFTFASGDTPEVDTSKGFANDAGTTGGKYADASGV
ncbi:hypothetical protein LCGC14_2708620 [marine sediment metagenome]|uniref:Baseplate protein J-like domain-containing protein n=1 Tax=marine sediment metagenome TaxID=412755 RepID=A0A0F9BMR3_9ZZZZ